MDLWYLSFVDEKTGKFLGVIVTPAENFIKALIKSYKFGNPGGQILAEPILDTFPLELRNRLLSREELENS